MPVTLQTSPCAAPPDPFLPIWPFGTPKKVDIVQPSFLGDWTGIGQGPLWEQIVNFLIKFQERPSKGSKNVFFGGLFIKMSMVSRF